MKVFSFLIFLGISVMFMSLTFMRPDNSHIKAARELIDMLDVKQKMVALFPFEDTLRKIWTYLPTTVERKGLFLKDMTEDQKEKVHELLQIYLSKSGYAQTLNIIGLEPILFELEGTAWRDPELYFIAIFGSPNADEPWGWKFEGHHIVLNFTIYGNEIAFEPKFYGANPAEVRQGPKKGFRALAKEEDLAFELLNSLDQNQKKAVVISSQTFNSDIVTTHLPEISPLEQVGVPYGNMSAAQQKKVMEIISEYLSDMPDQAAKERMKSLQNAGLDEIHFAWAGSLIKGSPHYYRLQGPTFLIEFDNSQNNANHIHSVWRDFDGDYGEDFIREHYKKVRH
jgi:hypothetical protein